MSVEQSNYIKLIAMITMLIDHIGLVLFPDQIILRIIGRISLPLFAYQLGIGYIHTKNLKKYMLRLLLFGVGVQLLYSVGIYYLRVDRSPGDFNIFFTLALGLAAVYSYDKGKYIYLLLTIMAPIMLSYIGINPDYGLYGIMLILIMYIEQKNLIRMAVFITAINLIYCFYSPEQSYIQAFSVMAILFLIKPLYLRFNMPNWAFYLFYPLHLAILYLISIAL
ncbi:MAG: TraX protein [Firmicutes bacterium ADurb.Bin193]|nr:MAG: TraX protein [Firmicutes bacterium ADurb.Bin193]